MPVKPRPVMERLLARVQVDSLTDCWNFMGATSCGYGVIGLGARTAGVMQTHRVAYTYLVGPIPVGLHIDHLCRNRRCCNPAHLEAVTQRENNIRAVRAKGPKTHCKHGHEFSPENTYAYARQRRCKTCHRAAYHRKKAAA